MSVLGSTRKIPHSCGVPSSTQNLWNSLQISENINTKNFIPIVIAGRTRKLENNGSLTRVGPIVSQTKCIWFSLVADGPIFIEKLGPGTKSNVQVQRRSLGPKHFTKLGLHTHHHHTPPPPTTQTFRTQRSHLGG